MWLVQPSLNSLLFIRPIAMSIRLQVWAKGAKPSNAGDSDTECKETSWGLGANITTKLVNPAGEVPACAQFY